MSFVFDQIDKTFASDRPSHIVAKTLLIFATIKGAASVLGTIKQKGIKNTLMGYMLSAVPYIPGASAFTDKAIEDLRDSIIPEEVANTGVNYELPETGMESTELLSLLKEWANKEEGIWQQGKASGAIYHGEPEFLNTLTEAYSMFALTNPLHPELFPYIRKMESEVVRMTLSLFHGDDNACGSMTSGGTESILMAMKAYRDRGLVEKNITQPEVIASATAHAAFDKAANYFGIKLVSIPANQETQQLEPSEVAKYINSNTVAIVASAPHFPHGVVDPVPELAKLALKYNIGLHVDCCLGSFLIPFAKELGADIPDYDFIVPGVTSISADTHKYGFSPKGSSVVMFNSSKLRHYMYYVSTSWTGGVYASPTITGSRPGALIASTWAALMSMGRKGYKAHMTKIMKSADIIRQGIQTIPGIKVVGDSQLSVVAFGIDPNSELASMLNIYKINEAMSKMFHWHLNTLQKPSCVHICVTYANADNAEQFVHDLGCAVAAVLERPQDFKGGSVQMYGMADAIGDVSDASGNSTGLLADLAKAYIDTLTYVPPRTKQ